MGEITEQYQAIWGLHAHNHHVSLLFDGDFSISKTTQEMCVREGCLGTSEREGGFVPEGPIASHPFTHMLHMLGKAVLTSGERQELSVLEICG